MVYSHWFPGTLISIFTGFLLDIISIFVVLYIVTRLFNGGFYFGSFFSTPFVDRCPISGNSEEPIQHLSKIAGQPQCCCKGSHNAMCALVTASLLFYICLSNM